MKKLILIVAAAGLTTGCSPLMYSGPYGRVPPPQYAQRRPQVEAVPFGRWDNVMRLPRASTIDVLTNDGAASIGLIAGADAQSVRLLMEGVEVRIARADIVRIDLVDLAGSDTAAVARKAARGALVGVGVVGVITGVIGGELWPPPARAVRAGVALGAVGAGEAEVTRRSPRMIYLAPEQSGRGATGPGGVPDPLGEAPTVLKPMIGVRSPPSGLIACEGPPVPVTASRRGIR